MRDEGGLKVELRDGRRQEAARPQHDKLRRLFAAIKRPQHLPSYASLSLSHIPLPPLPTLQHTSISYRPPLPTNASELTRRPNNAKFPSARESPSILADVSFSHLGILRCGEIHTLAAVAPQVISGSFFQAYRLRHSLEENPYGL
jgi:hypothetical protein